MGRNYEDLKVWQKAIDFAEAVCHASANFPSDEKYGLTSQLRRASVSVASNVAEGSGRGTDKEFIRFLYVARGSLAEVKTQLIISRRIGLLTQEMLNPLMEAADEISRMISGLRNSIETRDSRPEARDLTLIDNTGA